MKKEEIVEKLFNNKELSSDEIIFVAKNLNDGNTIVPYNHTTSDALLGCGISSDDATEMNKAFSEIMRKQNAPKSFSELVERVEIMMAGNEKWTRMVIIQCIKYVHDEISRKANNDVTSLLFNLLSGMKKKDDDINKL